MLDFCRPRSTEADALAVKEAQKQTHRKAKERKTVPREEEKIDRDEPEQKQKSEGQQAHHALHPPLAEQSVQKALKLVSKQESKH
jgi:hypothetical protein